MLHAFVRFLIRSGFPLPSAERHREKPALPGGQEGLRGPCARTDDDVLRSLEKTEAELADVTWGANLEPLRPEIISIFARQRRDGERRLASSYFQSGRGPNIGLDVLDAYNRALNTLKSTLSRQQDQSLKGVLSALDELIEAQRLSVRDADGYGMATLGEIRRDLMALEPQQAQSEPAGPQSD